MGNLKVTLHTLFKAAIANNEGREVKVESITACWENGLKVLGAKGTMS